MRQILVDWLVDVAEHFDQKTSTLHFAIELLDLYLKNEKETQLKSELQLLGTCCLKIADQYNEKSREYYRQDNARDYAQITADEYTSQQIVACEKRILDAVNFRVLQQSSYMWVHQFLDANWLSQANYEEIDTIHLMQKATKSAEFIADWSLISQEIRGKYSRETIGQAAVQLGCSICFTEPPIMHAKNVKEVKDCVKALRDLWADFTCEGSMNARFCSIKKKYLKYDLPACPAFSEIIEFSNVLLQSEIGRAHV